MASGKDYTKAYEETFEKEDLDELQKQWIRYVAAMKL
jgi:hypothetical protein